MKKIQLFFSGFYESWHDQTIDDAIRTAFMDDRGDVSEKDENAIWDADINWDAIHNEYAAAYTEAVGSELDLDLKFDELSSPKYYNFSTDKIYATIPDDQMKMIREAVEKHDGWAGYVKDNYTSYDGFISFYEPDITDEIWTREELDECQYNSMIIFWTTEIRGYDINELGINVIDEINAYELSTIQDAIGLVYDELDKKKTNQEKEQ